MCGESGVTDVGTIVGKLTQMSSGCEFDSQFGLPKACKSEEVAVDSKSSDNSSNVSLSEGTLTEYDKKSLNCRSISGLTPNIKQPICSNNDNEGNDTDVVKEATIERLSTTEEPQERFNISLNNGGVDIFYVTDRELVSKSDTPHIKVDHEEVIDTHGRNDYISQHRRETLRSFVRAQLNSDDVQPSQTRKVNARKNRDSKTCRKNKSMRAMTPTKRRLSFSKNDNESKRR